MSTRTITRTITCVFKRLEISKRLNLKKSCNLRTPLKMFVTQQCSRGITVLITFCMDTQQHTLFLISVAIMWCRPCGLSEGLSAPTCDFQKLLQQAKRNKQCEENHKQTHKSNFLHRRQREKSGLVLFKLNLQGLPEMIHPYIVSDDFLAVSHMTVTEESAGHSHLLLLHPITHQRGGGWCVSF